MRFENPLVPGRLIQRYKRFLADIALDDGRTITATVANTGAMTGLTTPGARVWLTHAPSPSRKYDYSWEMVEIDDGEGPLLVGVNTSRPNTLVADAIAAGLLPSLAGYASLRREVRYGANSRIDILLEAPDRPPCYVEVKNVHLLRQPRLAEFPDCVTKRGAKHLDDMAIEVTRGHRACLVFLIQYERAERFTLARDIDPAYARAYDAARAAGVEFLALTCALDPNGIEPTRLIPVL